MIQKGEHLRKKIKIDFSDFWHAPTEENKKCNPFFKLLTKRFEVELSETPDFLIYSVHGKQYLSYKGIRIFYTGENIRPNFKECDYAFSFDYPTTDRNYRLPLYKFYYDLEKLTVDKDVEALFETKTKFCNFVYSNDKAKGRIAFFKKLSQYKPVDSGGRVLNNLGHLVKDKVEFLKPYKFTIAFENSSHPGYTTEKILEAMIANTVPIYWGNPLIHLDFNPKSFINCHDYDDFDKVVEKIIELDKHDDLYKQYLQTSWFNDNIINEYLSDERILDRFETIFSGRAHKPVARTWKGRTYQHGLNLKRLLRKLCRHHVRHSTV